MLAFLVSFTKPVSKLALLGAAFCFWGVSFANQNQPSTPQALHDDNTPARGGTEQMEPDMAMSKQDKWGDILQKYTKEDPDGLVRFDYKKLQASPQDMHRLAAYIEDLSAQKPSSFERKKAMAYWANLYNAATVLVVTENYPVSSILKIKSGFRAGPWKRKLVTVEGQSLSLDNIEHDIMRPKFKTPLVHYMVNCASVGCPNLKPTPWRIDNLEPDLDEAARAYINSPRGASVKDGNITASKIFKWYKQDFGGNQAGVLAHIRQYANPELLAALDGKTRIKSYVYDWTINNTFTAMN